MLYVIIYLCIMFCIFFWDGYFGFGQEFDEFIEKNGSFRMTYLVWPMLIVMVPSCLIYYISSIIGKRRKKRIALYKKLKSNTEKEDDQFFIF